MFCIYTKYCHLFMSCIYTSWFAYKFFNVLYTYFILYRYKKLSSLYFLYIYILWFVYIIISLFCIQGSFDKTLGSFVSVFFGGGGRAAGKVFLPCLFLPCLFAIFLRRRGRVGRLFYQKSPIFNQTRSIYNQEIFAIFLRRRGRVGRQG